MYIRALVTVFATLTVHAIIRELAWLAEHVLCVHKVAGAILAFSRGKCNLDFTSIFNKVA